MQLRWWLCLSCRSQCSRTQMQSPGQTHKIARYSHQNFRSQTLIKSRSLQMPNLREEQQTHHSTIQVHRTKEMHYRQLWQKFLGIINVSMPIRRFPKTQDAIRPHQDPTRSHASFHRCHPQELVHWEGSTRRYLRNHWISLRSPRIVKYAQTRRENPTYHQISRN